MSLASKLLSASGGGVDPLYVDDVFSSFVYQGNGSTQTINNGIDLAGKGGMVWTKCRSQAWDHMLFDTARGINNTLQSNSTIAANTTSGTLTSFNSNGFSLGSNTNNPPGSTNSTQSYISHTFRRSPKFFDVVTYTGNGVAGRQIPHALGIAPGMVVVKSSSNAGTDWLVWHRSTSTSGWLRLNLTGQVNAINAEFTFGNNTVAVDPSELSFTVGSSGQVNASGATYVAYLFAHDPSADGIIQCGSYVGAPNINLGWEPQYLLVKPLSVVDDWYVVDTSRRFDVNRGDAINPNTSQAEANFYIGDYISPTATGFKGGLHIFGASEPVLYLAIRRSNKPPTLGTQVYNAIARTGTGAAATVTGVGFAPDLVIAKTRDNTLDPIWYDRLRGAGNELHSNNTNAELTRTNELVSFDMGGASLGGSGWQYVNWSGWAYINHFFKRAVGVFDEVCYTGDGSGNARPHNLTVVPELVITKRRDVARDWAVYLPNATPASSKVLLLNTTAAAATATFGATATTVGIDVDTAGSTNVVYLFATLPGISKVGSYTGNGTSQTLDMGFTTGARFFLVKRTDAAGDWYVFDVARGIISGNDGHLSLNTTAAEVTSNDSVDPTAVGIVVNQLAATNINVTSASYIYLSFS